MSKITLIRHGQASFGAENYDQLSDLGRLQASALGEYYLNHQIKFDVIVHGEMSRQAETAQILAKVKKFSGELVLDKAANEFDSESLLEHYLPILADKSEEFRQKICSEQKWFTDSKDFEMVFRALINLWLQDEDCPFESWKNFHQRTIALLNKIYKQHGANKKIALVTSGGLISVTMQAILKFADQIFVDMNLTINNASVTEIKIRDLTEDLQENKQLNASLLSFNNISPLVIKKQPELITRK